MARARDLKEDLIQALQIDLFVIQSPRQVHGAIYSQYRPFIETVMHFHAINLELDSHSAMSSSACTRQYTRPLLKQLQYRVMPDTSGPGRSVQENSCSGR